MEKHEKVLKKIKMKIERLQKEGFTPYFVVLNKCSYEALKEKSGNVFTIDDLVVLLDVHQEECVKVLLCAVDELNHERKLGEIRLEMLMADIVAQGLAEDLIKSFAKDFEKAPADDAFWNIYRG